MYWKVLTYLSYSSNLAATNLSLFTTFKLSKAKDFRWKWWSGVIKHGTFSKKKKKKEGTMPMMMIVFFVFVFY